MLDPTCLCCIGVAAKVNGLEFSANDETLTAADYIGLTEDEMTEWVGWNDCDGLNFIEIADLIEKEY